MEFPSFNSETSELRKDCRVSLLISRFKDFGAFCGLSPDQVDYSYKFLLANPASCPPNVPIFVELFLTQNQIQELQANGMILSFLEKGTGDIDDIEQKNVTLFRFYELDMKREFGGWGESAIARADKAKELVYQEKYSLLRAFTRDALRKIIETTDLSSHTIEYFSDGGSLSEDFLSAFMATKGVIRDATDAVDGNMWWLPGLEAHLLVDKLARNKDAQERAIDFSKNIIQLGIKNPDWRDVVVETLYQIGIAIDISPENFDAIFHSVLWKVSIETARKIRDIERTPADKRTSDEILFLHNYYNSCQEKALYALKNLNRTNDPSVDDFSTSQRSPFYKLGSL